MKINSLELKAYGPFTDKTLNFSTIENGLHIVFGPNEAGKSTALRGLVGLFYGFGHTTNDGWRHDYNSLCVGASVVGNENEVLNILRYKRRKNDLINENTGKPLLQDTLDQLLGRTDQQTFEHAFGISHDALRKGVESVLAAGGNLGHALFTAGSGLNTLKQVMKHLDELQKQLFTPRAKKAAINAKILELTQLRKQQRAASIGHRQWKAVKDNLSDLKNKKEKNTAKLADLSRRISLYTRYQSAIPHVVTWDSLTTELEDLGSAPELDENFTHLRTKAQVALKIALQEFEQLNLRINDIREKMAGLTFDEQLVANADKIEALAAEALLHIKAMADSAQLENQEKQWYASIDTILSHLRPGLTVDHISTFKPTKSDRSKITRIANQKVAMINEVQEAQDTLESAKKILENANAELKSLGSPKKVDQLRGLIERAVKTGNLEHRIIEEQAQLDRLNQQAELEIQSMGLWKGKAHEFDQLALPYEETVRQFQTEAEEIRRDILKIKQETKTFKGEIDAHKEEIAQLNIKNRLPDIEDLAKDRNLRNFGWQSIKKVWIEHKRPDEKFVKDFGINVQEEENLEHGMAKAYEKSVQRADRTADTLRENTDTVVKISRLKNDIEKLKEKIRTNDIALANHEDTYANLMSRWKALWDKINVTPLSPAEMRQWLIKSGEVKHRLSETRDRQTLILRLSNEMKLSHTDVMNALTVIEVSIPKQISHMGLMDLAQHVVAENEMLENKVKHLESRITEYRQNIELSITRVEKAQKKRDAWQSQWQHALKSLGFSGEADPDEVNDFILGLDEVYALLDKVSVIKSRIVHMAEDYSRYKKSIYEIAEKISPELMNQKAEELAILLNENLKHHKEVYKEYHRLDIELADVLKQKDTVEKKIVGYEEELRQLCEQAGASHADELVDIEKKARQKAKLTDALAIEIQRLSELSAGKSLPSFIDDIKSQNTDDLAAKIATLSEEQTILAQDAEGQTGDIALKNKELETMGGEAQALVFAEQAQACSGEVMDAVQHYVRLKLAYLVLQKSIEHYQEKNQNPVLKAAGQFFSVLTSHMFSGLRGDFDEKGNPVIKAIRPSGELLAIEQMSDGSRDQLFLALRLGGLAQYIKNNGPMPFIIDDVLVHFDDIRSKAAFKAFDEIARQTQIIFFTHHEHLLD